MIMILIAIVMVGTVLISACAAYRQGYKTGYFKGVKSSKQSEFRKGYLKGHQEASGEPRGKIIPYHPTEIPYGRSFADDKNVYIYDFLTDSYEIREKAQQNRR